jgi:hypothetical protein
MLGSIQKIEVEDDKTTAFIFSKNQEYARDLELVRKLTDILIDTKSKISEVLENEE